MDKGKLLHKLIDLFEFKVQYQMESSGLKPQDMHLLEWVAATEGVPTLELSRQCGIPPATIVAILDRLQDKHLVERIRSDQDKRVVHVTATTQGRRLVAQHIAEDEAFVHNLFGVLPESESQLLQKLLGELLHKLDMERLFIANGQSAHRVE